ncbi:hypothetical protein C8R44DRAFT_799724 [Mycena epipterygia]|nr:hypothetical protein C8R44DRAFT_799724 [Mycena epipterygia]
MRRELYHYIDADCWLSQANHVFSQIPTLPKHEEYFLVDGITDQLSFSGYSKPLPEGYLFLCPVEDLRDDTGRWLPYPGCPAYWSLDSSGSQRLSPEEESSLGFPSLQFEMELSVKSWDESVYGALSRFHLAKGFDAHGRDVARHLGYPLYEISSGPTVDGVRIEETSSDSSEVREALPVLAAPHPQKF